MGYFDYLETESVPNQFTYEGSEPFVSERGTTMDIFHDLWLGSGQAVEILGRGIQHEGIQNVGEAMGESQFAKPDVSQHYDTQSRIGKIIDGIITSAPPSLAIAGTTIAGGVLGGPLGAIGGYAAAMGIYGRGTYDEAYDEISERKPESSEQERKDFSTAIMLSEVGWEVVGNLMPFAGAKAISKTISKDIMKSLIGSGRMTSKQAVGVLTHGIGGAGVTKAIVGGGAADGLSEVATALTQAATRETYEMQEEMPNLIDLFIIGSFPGGAIAAGTIALESRQRTLVKKKLNDGLKAETFGEREGTLSEISGALSNISPELGEMYYKGMLTEIIKGPVSLDTEIITKETTEEVKKDIINEPEKILEEKGILTTVGQAHTGLRTGFKEDAPITEERPIVTHPAPPPDPMIQEGIEKELEQRAKADQIQTNVDMYMTVSRDTLPLSEKREVQKDGTEAMVPGTIAEASVPLYDALILDNSRSQAITQGMQNVLVDSNQLAEITDLDERSRLQKKIEKTQKQITKEVENHVKETRVEVPAVETVVTKKAPKLDESTTVKPKVAAEKPVVKKKPVVSEKTKVGTEGDPTALNQKELDRAKGLMEEGVTSDDAAILAKRGISSTKKPVEVEKGRFTDGTKVEKGTTTKGKQFKVTKDGVEYRASSQKMYTKAIQEGTVSSLELYEQKTRIKDVEKELPKLSAKQKDDIAVFMKENKEHLTKDHSEAIVRTVADGKELSLKNVNDTYMRMQKAEENAREDQKLQRAGLRSDIKSAEDLFASEEATAAQEDVMDDAEAEDTSDMTEDSVGKAAVIQKGKGEAVLKNVTYYKAEDGTWKSIAKKKSKELPKGTEVKTMRQTPSGAFYTTEQRETEDGITRATYSIHKEDGSVITDGLQAYEIDEVLQDLVDKSKVTEKPKRVTIIRRRKDLHESLETAGKGTTSKFPDAFSLLESVLEGGPLKMDKKFAKLAEYLMKRANVEKLKDIKVVIGKGNSFNSGTNTITLREITEKKTRLHEIVHAFTVNEMKGNKELMDKVSELRESALKEALATGLITEEQASALEKMKTSQDFKAMDDVIDWGNKREVVYGLMNNNEFLSQAFSSKDFQSLLDSIKIDKKKSLLDKLIDVVLKFLGLDSTSHTVMREVLVLVPDISYIGGKQNYGLYESVDVPKIDEEVAAIMSGKGPNGTLKENLLKQGGNIKTFAESIARPISDIILTYSNKIYSSLMKMETDLMINQKKYTTKAEPFMSWFEKLTKSEQVRYHMALLNSNLSESKRIIDKIPKQFMKPLNEMLGTIRERQEDVGFGTTDKEYYFPRRVKDVNGLMEHLLKGEDFKGPIGIAFKEEAKRLGVPALNEEQRTQVMTDMFQSGYLRQLPRPGASRKRTIPFVTRETYKFYSSVNDSIAGHIFEMNEKIGQREFIGGSTRKKQVRSLETLFKKIEGMEEGAKKSLAIAEYDIKATKLEDLEGELSTGVSNMIYKEMGKAPTADQDKVINLIQARLRQKGAYGVTEIARNIGYITTMGNFLSALTQLGDIPILFYAHGVNKDSIGAVGTAFKNVWKIARSEFSGQRGEIDAFVDQADFTNQLRDFSQGNITSKWVDKIFQYSGLKYTDLVGKEAFMQAAYKKWQRSESRDAFFERYEPMFAEGTQKVYQDIQLGKKTDDIIAVLISELSDYQPVTLSQQSSAYLTAGSMRIFFMLKTFTLRATSAAFREAAVDINKGGAKNIAKGMSKAASILMIYAVAGAGADELKDLIRGKESSVSDNTIDNLIQMFMLSKFSLEKGLRSDQLFKTLTGDLFPPIRYIDSFAADVYAMAKEDKELKFKSLQSVPLIGTIAYGQSKAGQASFASQEKKAIMADVKKNKKDKKGAYSGNLSKRIREYNKGISRGDKITNDSVMRTYK